MFRDFCDDIMLHRAIERNIEIIGEAAGRILKLDAVRRSRMHGLPPPEAEGDSVGTL